jgi:flagella basal body P-ring formation protein FlgA
MVIALAMSIVLSGCQKAETNSTDANSLSATNTAITAGQTKSVGAAVSATGQSQPTTTATQVQADDLSNTINKVVALNRALPAGSALLPDSLIYVQKASNLDPKAGVFNDKMALAGAVLARDLPAGAPISLADIVQIIGSPKRKTAADVLVSTKNIAAGQKLDKTNTGYWTPTPNYRPMMVQMALHDEKETVDCVASNTIPKAQILTVSNTRKATSN